VRRFRLLLWLAVAIAAAAGAAIFLTHERQGSAPVIRTTASSSSLGGSFTLIGTDGQPFASTRLAGKPYAIFFGFTHCPDVCPTTLARLVRLRQQLGPKDDPFAIVFVSVDPERDRPVDMRNYVGLFNSPVIGLTGSPEQVAKVQKQFGIFSQKVPDQTGGYSVDHTATVLLFDATGKLQSTIAPDEPDSAALDKLKMLASAG